jgi:Cu(I)/Ag(I) efflux system membrane fusion protein
MSPKGMAPTELHENDMDMSPVNEVMSAQTNGTINSVNTERRMVNISRAAIDKWQRPAATLDFLVDKALNMDNFTKGNAIDFIFEIRRDDFVITELMIPEPIINQPILQE